MSYVDENSPMEIKRTIAETNQTKKGADRIVARKS